MGWMRSTPERKDRTCLRCEYFRGIVNGKVRCFRELPAYVSSHSNDRDTCTYWDPDASWKHYVPDVTDKERLRKIRRGKIDDDRYMRFTVGCFALEIGRTNWIDFSTNEFRDAVTLTNIDGEDESIMLFIDEWDGFKKAIGMMDEEIKHRRKEGTANDSAGMHKEMKDCFTQVISECLKNRKNIPSPDNDDSDKQS